MLVVNIKEGETIERAIKRYKKKCDQTQLIKSIKNKQYYLKPSAKRKEKFYKAIYRYKMLYKTT